MMKPQAKGSHVQPVVTKNKTTRVGKNLLRGMRVRRVMWGPAHGWCGGEMNTLQLAVDALSGAATGLLSPSCHEPRSYNSSSEISLHSCHEHLWSTYHGSRAAQGTLNRAGKRASKVLALVCTGQRGGRDSKQPKRTNHQDTLKYR